MTKRGGASLRVLHIGKFYPPDHGGMEVYLADLVGEQRRQGVDVCVLAHGSLREDDPRWLVRVPVRWTLAFAPLAPGFAPALRRLLREIQPDVIHVHMPNLSAFWLLALGNADTCCVVHWHADVVVQRQPLLAFLYRFYRVLEHGLLARADAIIATSPDYLAASAPLAPWQEKSTVVPLGLDPARLPEVEVNSAGATWSPDVLRVLSIGRLTYYKAFETLIAAVARTPGVELLIVGEGSERARLEQCIAAATPTGERPRTRLLGGVDDIHKNALLATCDLFTLASRERTEAFGVAVLEAMRHGKPCLVSDLAGSGLPWLVRSAGAGRCVAVDDVPAWTQELVALRDDEKARAAYGAAARQAFVARFGIEAAARGVQEVYQSLEVAAPAVWRTQPLFVIPAHNEEETVGDVVAKLRASGWRDILVIDDQSSDATAAVARAAGARVLAGVLPMGAWGAMQTGIRYAVREGYAQVVTLDADGQHEPDCVPTLLAAARDADFVIGAATARGSRARHVAWAFFRWLTGLQVTDLTSGFRCYNRAACEILADEEASLLDYQDLGILLLLRSAGMSVAEVQVTMHPRTRGTSRIFMSWRRVARYMLESTLLCVARWHPRQRTRS